jgi:HEAT repeat protein
MKSSITAYLFLCCTLLALPLRAADLAPLVAEVAKHESGRNPAPLRQLEQLVRDTAGKPAERAELEAAVAKLLVEPATFEARRFACQQLAIIGTDASLPAIASLLGNDETVGLACLALSTRRTPKAVEILRHALPTARGQARLQLIVALGNHQDAQSVRAIAGLARDGDTATANLAIIALGKIGTTEARETLARLRQAATPAQAAALVEATLTVSGQLAAAGNTKAAAALHEEMLAPSQPAQIRRGALDALLRLDHDRGERRIVAVLRGSDRVLKPVAIAAITSVKSAGASARFAAELSKLTPDEQALVLEALASVGDAPARAAIRGQLAAGAPAIRLAAIKAIGQAGDTADVGVLALSLAQAKTPEEQSAVVDSLTALRGGDSTDQAIAAELEKSFPPSKALFLTILANRNSRLAVPLLLAATTNRDPATVKVAFRALGRLANANDLPVMLDRLATAPSPEFRRDAETAVAQVLGKIEATGRRADILEERLRNTTDPEARCSWLRLLAVAGDAKALAALQSATSDSDARVADTAIRTLAEWRDPNAWDSLLAIYRQPRSEQHRVLALRGLVRLATTENARPTPTLIARYRQLLDRARGDNDFRLLLGALAGVGHPDALPLVEPLLANAAVRAEAVLAVKKIAAAIKAQHPQAAQAALQRLR